LASKEDKQQACAETDSTDKKRQKRYVREGHTFLKILILSALLHTGIFAYPFRSEISAEFKNVRNRITNIFKGLTRTSGKSEYIGRLKESREKQEDDGIFYLKSEYFAGGIDANELKEAERKLTEIIEYFRKLAAKEKNIFRVLHELIQEQAAYKGKSSYLSRLLLSRKGNCEARAKLIVSVINKIYPDLPVQLQFYRDHVRALVQINGKWYAMEKPTLTPINEDDLKNTVLAEPSIFIKSYLGEKVSYKEVELTDNPKPPKDHQTDTPFKNPIDPKVNKKLADYSSGPIPDEEKEVRYNFDEVTKINSDGEPEDSPDYKPLPNRPEDPIELTFLTEDEMKEILNRDAFSRVYGTMSEREKRLVDLYRDKKYETLVRRFNIPSLKGMIDKEAKKFKEYEESGYAEEDRNALMKFEELRKKILAVKDISLRQMILCQAISKNESEKVSEVDLKKLEEVADKRYELRKMGVKDISDIDDTVDFVTFWLSLNKISGFPDIDERDPDKECKKILNKNGNK